MATFYPTGEISTAVRIKNTNAKFEHGHWAIYPLAEIQANNTVDPFFKAVLDRNYDDSNGEVAYTADDGTEFILRFRINSNNINLVNNTMEIRNLSGPWKIGLIKHTTGPDAKFTWGIVQISSFVDSPVFIEDILAAQKCNLLSRQKIWEYSACRDRVKLADCFDTDMNPEAKIWCAVNPLFLTPKSKSLLCRDLAQAAIEESSPQVQSSFKIDKFLFYNERLADGDLLRSESADLLNYLNEMQVKVQNQDNRDVELLSVMYSLLDPNLDKGWSTAVSSYINFSKGKELIERQNKIIELIKKRL